MASLTVIKGPDKGQQFVITGERPTIGRDTQSSVRLHDGEISRHHAELRKTKSGYILYDLQSSNGTFLNNEKVQYSLIHTGDRITIGQTEMIFTADAPAPKSNLANKISMVGEATNGDASAILSSLRRTNWNEMIKKPDQSGSEWLKDSLANLNTMYEAAEAVRRITDIDDLLDRIMDLSFDAVKPERGCIMLKDAETGLLIPKAIRYADQEDGDEHIAISRTITDYVMKDSEGVLIADAMHDDRFSASESVAELGIREAICVPLCGRHDVLGVLYVDVRSNSLDILKTQQPSKLKENHLHLMVAIGYQAGIAIEDTRFYEAALQAERLAAIGQTIATLSHHIKNILQGLKSGSYLVNMGIDGHQQSLIEQGWSVVQKNQDKIFHLVMDMLSFSKEREPSVEMTDLAVLVQDVVELMKARAAENRVEINLDLDPQFPRVAIDPEGIHRALLNIITNAIDALVEQPDDRNITIQTKVVQAGRYFQIIVKDNGPGIPDEEQKRIFHIFHSTKGSKGTGLGLAVSQKIIQEHGGQIRIDSSPGEGATFVMELPLQRQLPSISARDDAASSTYAASEG